MMMKEMTMMTMTMMKMMMINRIGSHPNPRTTAMIYNRKIHWIR